jgi:hypothetical protein
MLLHRSVQIVPNFLQKKRQRAQRVSIPCWKMASYHRLSRDSAVVALTRPGAGERFVLDLSYAYPQAGHIFA